MIDHLFPRYHVRPMRGFLNDPNGPIFVDGLLHLYFQYRHTLDAASPVLWAHVTSPDLAHWTHHRPAMAPHPGQSDRDGCWSGNTVLDDAGRVRAFYSGYVEGEPLQATLSATSEDGGYSFGPAREVVPDHPADDMIAELRDPFVWRDANSGGWRMVLGARTEPETATARLYASDDLDTWRYLGPLARMDRTQGDGWDSGEMWECPQVLAAGDGLVVVVGSYAEAEGTMDVLSFAVPSMEAIGLEVAPEGLHRVDDGPDFYAASVLGESPHGPLMWGWATEARTREWCREDGWSGMLTLPRVVTVGPDGSLGSSPVPTLDLLRGDAAGHEVVGRSEGIGPQLEFVLEPEPADGGGGAYGVRLCFGDREHLEILVDAAAGSVAVDRRRASLDPRADGGVVTAAGVDGLGSAGAGVHGFLDGSILELFLPGGRVLTMRFYPTTAPPWAVERVGSARLCVWALKGSGA